MKDNTAAATKADIKGLMEQIDGVLKQFHDDQERWKDEIIRHFDVVVEDIRHDLAGANRDEIELMKDRQVSHQRRITRLDRQVGIYA